MGFRLDTSGLDFGKLTDLSAREPALLEGAKVIGAASQLLVPKESDELAASMTVTAEGNTAKIEYGTPYARYQHEGIEFNHPSGGQAKYLEQPMNSEKDAALQATADKLAEEW